MASIKGTKTTKTTGNGHSPAPAVSTTPAREAPRKAAAPSPLHGMFQRAMRVMRESLVERDPEIQLIFTALVAGEHVLLVGPPGTAKSLLIDSLAQWIEGRKFSVLLTKFSQPEEVVGHLSLPELKAGRYLRVTDGKLPCADVAFIDEIFKASSAILNTLLKLLNERKFDKGDGVLVDCPLQICLAASNEWPQEREELGALFDRFLFRKAVREVDARESLRRLVFGSTGDVAFDETITPEQLAEAQSQAWSLGWSREAEEVLLDIFLALKKEGVMVGNRRQKKARLAAQAAAWLACSPVVEPRHLSILQHVLWSDPVEAPRKAADVILKAADPVALLVSTAMSEAEAALAALTDRTNIRAVTGCVAKLEEIGHKLSPHKGHEEADRVREFLWANIRSLKVETVEREARGSSSSSY